MNINKAWTTLHGIIQPIHINYVNFKNKAVLHKK